MLGEGDGASMGRQGIRTREGDVEIWGEVEGEMGEGGEVGEVGVSSMAHLVSVIVAVVLVGVNDQRMRVQIRHAQRTVEPQQFGMGDATNVAGVRRGGWIPFPLSFGSLARTNLAVTFGSVVVEFRRRRWFRCRG